ncbi:hypothetical protein Hanom_Chr14g01274361 [Helianthus anomalus]
MVCLKFVWILKVWILCFSDLHSVICGFRVCFMVEIVVFYDFVHFVGKMDFVAEPHPSIKIKQCTHVSKITQYHISYTTRDRTPTN